MRTKNLLQELKVVFEQHKPFIVNYGKGMNGEDIKELATWDNEKKLYSSDTGYWGMKLLLEIAKGEVKDTSIELEE